MIDAETEIFLPRASAVVPVRVTQVSVLVSRSTGPLPVLGGRGPPTRGMQVLGVVQPTCVAQLLTGHHVTSCRAVNGPVLCVCVCVCLFIYTYIHNTFFRPPGSNPLSRVYKRPTMTCVYIHAHTHTHTHTHTPTNVVLFIISI